VLTALVLFCSIETTDCKNIAEAPDPPDEFDHHAADQSAKNHSSEQLSGDSQETLSLF
jgi:hypothetical protein